MTHVMKIHAYMMENVPKRLKFSNKPKSQKVVIPFSIVQFYYKMLLVIVSLSILEIGVKIKRILVFQILVKKAGDNVSNRVTHLGK